MRELKPTSKFKKDLKSVSQYKSFKRDEFEELLTHIQNGDKLDAKFYNHKMTASGCKYMGYWNLHFKPDIILIYDYDDNFVNLIRIGKHNDLGIKESLE